MNAHPPNLSTRLRQHLLWRIHRRYQTITQTVSIHGVSFDFTRIADPNRVLDEVADEEDRREKVSGIRRTGDQLHLPYWAELWDSAYGIAQHLIACAPQDMTSTRHSALDLGCGMGFAGTVAARVGWSVLFADLEAPALMFARLNSLPNADRTRARQLNWQTDRLDETFDLIIGADILYERKQWEHLDRFWQAHLAPRGRILLGEPGRQTGDLFIPWIQSHGWTLTPFEQPVSTRPKPIRIFQLTRP